MSKRSYPPLLMRQSILPWKRHLRCVSECFILIPFQANKFLVFFQTSELKADKVYTDADSGYCQRGTSPAPEITVDPPSSGEPEAEDELMLAIAEEMKSVVIYPEPEEAIDLAALGTPGKKPC